MIRFHGRNVTGVSPAERERMIREAAYFRALKRGFADGDPLDDWLQAEHEIERLLPSVEQQKLERAAYRRLRQKTEKLLSRMEDGVDAVRIRQAIDTAAESLISAGKYSAQTVDAVRRALSRDLAWAVQRMGPKWTRLQQEGTHVLGVWAGRSRSFLKTAAAAAADWAREHLHAEWRVPEFAAGEMVAGGLFECVACKEQLRLRSAGHLPLCPACGQRAFHRLE